MVKVLTLNADVGNTRTAIDFVANELIRMDAPVSERQSMMTAVEEVFLNIANYAYRDGKGDVTLQMETDDSGAITLTFIDRGIDFDPLAKEDPDVTLPIEKRPIGGLGIYLVKKTMDDVVYQHEEGENRLTIRKSWSK